MGRSVKGKWMGAREEKGGRAKSERAEGARARSRELGSGVHHPDTAGSRGGELRGGT